MVGGEVVTAVGKPLVTAAVKPAASGLWRKLRPDISESALDAAAAQLAADVARIERTRLDQLQVSPGTGIPLRFSDLAAVETVGSNALVRGSLPEVAPYYQGLKAPRRLLVVGEPGSGKTVLILHLILDLLRRRGAGDPVPVRINATSWDGRTNLADLLVEKLSDQYAVHKRTARALVDSGRILPMIDGLDEMDANEETPHRAQAAVDRFNEPPWRGRSLVVTCRSRVYEAIRAAKDGAGITRCETVSMRPLAPDEIAEHVQTLLDNGDSISTRYGRRLAPLLEELAARPKGILARALETPWMFTLAMAYLEQADEEAVAALIEADTDDRIADLLFAAQIPIACRNQPGEPSTWRYREPDVEKWLRTLAAQLGSDPSSGPGRTELALHQVWLLAGERRAKRLHNVTVGLGCGLGVGLVFGLVFGLELGLTLGVGAVLGCGLGSALPGEDMFLPERVVGRTRRKGSMLTRLVFGLIVGGTFGLPFGLVAGLVRGLATGLTSGLVSGLAVGLAGVLTLVPLRFQPPREGSREIRDDIVAGLVFAVAFGLAFGLGTGLPFGLTVGLAAGLSGALAFGLVFPGAAGRYGCATLIFRRTGIFAARPVKFLEWAVDAGLLRITGTAYQFRHETYREWLTTHPAPATGTQPAA